MTEFLSHYYILLFANFLVKHDQKLKLIIVSLNSELEKQKQEPETAIFRQARPHYYDPFNPVQLPQFILPLSPSRFYFSKLNQQQQQNGFFYSNFSSETFTKCNTIIFWPGKMKTKI